MRARDSSVLFISLYKAALFMPQTRVGFSHSSFPRLLVELLIHHSLLRHRDGLAAARLLPSMPRFRWRGVDK